MKGEEGGDKKSHAKITNNNIIGDDCRTVQGTSKAYTVSRLKRDRPDLFEKVVAGELSANKAAIEAGFRRKPTTIEQIKTLWQQVEQQKGHSDQMCR
jgi:hypothetical protein